MAKNTDKPQVTGNFLTCHWCYLRGTGVYPRSSLKGVDPPAHTNARKSGPALMAVWTKSVSSALTASCLSPLHCLGSNPGRGMWESCQWLGMSRWFSLGILHHLQLASLDLADMWQKSDQKRVCKFEIINFLSPARGQVGLGAIFCEYFLKITATRLYIVMLL